MRPQPSRQRMARGHAVGRPQLARSQEIAKTRVAYHANAMRQSRFEGGGGGRTRVLALRGHGDGVHPNGCVHDSVTVDCVYHLRG